MKVVHMSSAHRIDDVRIFHKECRTLASSGYEVVLIATGDYQGVCDGVRIRSVAPAKSRFERMTRTARQVWDIAMQEDAQLYHFHDPELMWIALDLRHRNKRVIYDVHENLPAQVMSKHWIPSALRPLVSAACRSAERLGGAAVDAIVAANRSVERRFPKDKTILLGNYPLRGEYVLPNATPYLERGNTAIFIGVISAIRSAREMVDAIAMMPDDLSCDLWLVGEIVPRDLETGLRERSGWSQVKYVGWQPRAAVAQLLDRARIGLVLAYPVPNHIEAHPNKLFEYMSAGIPVVCSDFRAWRDIVEGHGCGIVANPCEPESIAQAIQWLLTHPTQAAQMGARGQKAVNDTLNWETESRKLLRMYEQLLQQR